MSHGCRMGFLAFMVAIGNSSFVWMRRLIGDHKIMKSWKSFTCNFDLWFDMES